jgi:hypothetical protein
MKAIIGTKKVELNGKVYKTRFNILTDKLRFLPFSFVQSGVITDAEWACSEQLIIDRFNLMPVITKIDGRKKEFKSLPYFSWSVLKEII